MAKRPFNNRNLFSNHYLDNQIRSAPEWGKDDHLAAFGELKRIYEGEAAFVGGMSEAQLEERLLRRVFAVILPEFEVQGATRSREFPDYAFFPDREARDRAQGNKDSESFFLEAFAVGEVKRWDASLDRFGKDRQDKRRNPSFQIWLYLQETEPGWGVLTNGERWRLYRQERPLDVYYEVDLPALLAAGDTDSFRYFYYFFRKEAFLPNERGEVFLEEVLRGSANYAREIGENLKENVYRAMKVLADGFIRWPENRLDPADSQTRGRVQRSTMILLYRFLFLLYAEGKELLDLKDERYASSYSFDHIKKEVASRLDGPAPQGFLPIRRSLWSDLSDLFRLIDLGSERLGIGGLIDVPAYNGGLFDPARHPDLAEWTVGDSYLAEAIDLLSRSEGLSAGARGGGGRKKGDAGAGACANGGGGKGFVDYSTLEIRHLGSIYEGLLEYSLAVADEDLVVSGGRDRRWIPLADYNRGRKKEKSFQEFSEFDRARAGELYLTTDRGERKATGSYYTPDYIVDYIVEKTVGPVVEQRWKEALEREESLIEATLSVKVLDPAMGSGHFLVGAVEYLAGKLLQAAERDIEWGWVEDQGQFTSEWAKREVVSRCVYGVDLNELAVELAKVSLWLSTIAKEKPLSFLDHRLKQGNSLVGARLSDLMNYPGSVGTDKDQATLPSFVSPRFLTHLIGKIRELEEIGDDSLSEIKEKERVFEEFRNLPEYTKARAIANVHTAVYFGGGAEARATPSGTKDADQVYHDLFWAVGGDEGEWRRKTSPRWFSEAQRIAGERSFFHWELEFPEVFFAGGAVKERAGWDAVVGNPPWIDVQEIDASDKEFQRFNYESARGKYDQYAVFIELGLGVLSSDGYLGEIIQNKFLVTGYGEGLRSFLSDRANVTRIVDMNDAPIFGDASTYPLMIFLKQLTDETSSHDIEVMKFPSSRYLQHDKDLSQKYSELVTALISKDVPKEIAHFIMPESNYRTSDPWRLESKQEKVIWSKVFDCSAPFIDQAQAINRSLTIGLNDAFVGKKEDLLSLGIESSLIKPLTMARDLKRYTVENSDMFIIFPYVSNDEGEPVLIDLEHYPGAKRYFESIRSKLEARRWFGKTIVEAGMSWYGFLYISKYLLKNKLLFPKIASTTLFASDNKGDVILLEPAYIAALDSDYSEYYLLSCLNSKLLTCRIRRETTTLSGGFMELQVQYVERLPIRRISFSTPEADRRRQAEELAGLCAAGRFGEVLEAVDGCLSGEAAGEAIAGDERSDVVHDLLAHLAEEMIRMNREKQEEIRGFLAWLSDYTGARIDDLSNKTKVSAYYEIEFSELLAVLKKNKKKLAVDPGRRAFGEDLRREYSASVEKLAPLLLRIGEVDRLIDLIVYRLYGLTEAEIAVVEGSLS